MRLVGSFLLDSSYLDHFDTKLSSLCHPSWVFFLVVDHFVRLLCYTYLQGLRLLSQYPSTRSGPGTFHLGSFLHWLVVISVQRSSSRLGDNLPFLPWVTRATLPYCHPFFLKHIFAQNALLSLASGTEQNAHYFPFRRLVSGKHLIYITIITFICAYLLLLLLISSWLMWSLLISSSLFFFLGWGHRRSLQNTLGAFEIR